MLVVFLQFYLNDKWNEKDVMFVMMMMSIVVFLIVIID